MVEWIERWTSDPQVTGAGENRYFYSLLKVVFPKTCFLCNMVIFGVNKVGNEMQHSN